MCALPNRLNSKIIAREKTVIGFARQKSCADFDDQNVVPCRLIDVFRAHLMTTPIQDEIWVFVADPIRIDLRIFNSWVNGVKGMSDNYQ